MTGAQKMRAPGPEGTWLWGSLQPFKADAIGFLRQSILDYGPIVRFRFGPVTTHLINAPDDIDHVLSRNGQNYDKRTRSASRIAATTGDSLLSANPEAWARHRHLIQPSFQPKCFNACGPAIDALLLPAIDRWLRAGTIDIVDEMMKIVIGAAIRILFSADIEAKAISRPLDVLLTDTWRRIEAPLDPSMLGGFFHRRAFKKAVAEIDAIVFDLIAKRKKAGNRPDDVLSRLLIAHESAGDSQLAEQKLSDRELRDAAVTLLLAGHETTANALAWAFIHTANGHHGNGLTTDPQYIFAEALRLHPSIWVIERRAIASDTIGGYQIPEGSSVLISPYLLHRDAAHWQNPEVFDPARFAQQTPYARHTYLPFGLGQHRCVGLHLARAMAGHILATVFGRVNLALTAGQNLKHQAGITLRPSSPVMMTVTQKA